MTCSNHCAVLLNLLVVSLFAACAATQPTDQGIIYYQQGLYDEAAIEWRPLADEGDYVAQHSMGVLSREGNTEAIAYLQQRDVPVPEPDLYSQQIQDRTLEKQQSVLDFNRPPIRGRDEYNF